MRRRTAPRCAGADYVAVADAMLTIAAGDEVGMFTVQTLEDELAEDATRRSR